MMRWLLFASLLLLQDAAEWARQLGDDDPDKREAAQKALIEMGAKALDVVRPLTKSDDLEVRARATLVVAGIERVEAKRAVLGPQIRVTVHAKSFKAALAQIDPKIEAPVDDKPMGVDLVDKPMWEALDTIARLHGNVDFVTVDTDERMDVDGWIYRLKTLRGEARPAGTKPTAYVGPFRIRVEKICRTRNWINWGSITAAGTELTIRVDLQPNVHERVWCGMFLRIDETQGQEIGGYLCRFGLPPSSARTIERIDGRVRLGFVVGSDAFTFDGWDKAKGTKHRLGDTAVTFTSGSCDGKVCTVHFKLEPSDPRAIPDLQACPLNQDGSRRVRHGELGKTVSSVTVLEYIAWIPHDPAVGHDRIEVRKVTDEVIEEIPFEFKDVPLPEF